MAETAELIIKLTDQFSAELNKATSSITNIENKMKAAKVPTDQLGGSFGGLGRQMMGILPISLSVAGAVAGIREAWDMAVSGMKDNRIDAAFEVAAQGAGNAAAAIERLREASGRKYDDQQLEAVAMKANRVGIAVEDSYHIIQLARLRAMATGEDELALSDRLIQSLASGRTQGMQQLGVFIDRNRAETEYAERLGITDRKLTEIERKEASRIAGLRQMALLSSDVSAPASGIEQMQGRWANMVSNLQQNWATAVNPIEAARIAGQKAAASFSADADVVAEKATWMAHDIEQLEYRIAQAYATAGRSDKSTGHFEQMAVELEARLEGVKLTLSGELSQAFQEVGEAAATAMETAETAVAQALSPEALTAAANNLGVLRDRLIQLRDAADKLGLEGIAEAFGEQIGASNESMGELRRRAAELSRNNEISVAAYQAQVRELAELNAHAKTLTAEEADRRAQLQQLTDAWKDYNSESIKAIALVKEFASASAALDVRTDATLRERVALDLAIEGFRAAQTELQKALASGDIDQATTALSEYRAASERTAETMEELGVQQKAINGFLGTAGTQADYAAARIDAMRDGLEQYMITALAVRDIAAEALTEAADNEGAAIMAQATATASRALSEAREAFAKARSDRRPSGSTRQQSTDAPRAKEEEESPEGITALAKLRLEATLAGDDALLQADIEYRTEQQRIWADFANGRITLDRALLEQQIANAQREQAVKAETDRRALELAQNEYERFQSKLDRMQAEGTATDYWLDRAELAMQRKLELITEEQYLDKLAVLNAKNAADEKEAAQKRMADAIELTSASAKNAIEQLQQAMTAMGSTQEIDKQFAARIELMSTAASKAATTIMQAMGSTSGNWQDSLLDMMQASGQAVSGFAGNAKEAAYIMAAFSAASAIVAIVMEQYQKAAGLGAASAMYLALAGRGLSQPSSGSAARNKVSSGITAPSAQASGNVYLTVNVTGQPLNTQQDIAAYVVQSLHVAKYVPGLQLPQEMIP